MYDLMNIKTISDLYITGAIKKKDIKNVLNSIEYKIFEYYYKIRLSQLSGEINRHILRVKLNEFLDKLKYQIEGIDYLKDICGLDKNIVAYQKLGASGELSSTLVRVKKRK